MQSHVRARHRWPAFLLCGMTLLLAGSPTPAPAQTLVQVLPWPQQTAPGPVPGTLAYNLSRTRLPARVVRAAMPPAWPADAPASGSGPVAFCCGTTPLPPEKDEPEFPIHLVAHVQIVPRSADETSDQVMPAFQIQLEPPGPGRLYRLESEAGFRERVRQETPRRPYEPVIFPTEPAIAQGVYDRHWPGRREKAEPHYLCYQPLFFEQPNVERYGWDLGVIAPLVSVVTFYYDFLMLPYHALASESPCYDCSAGYCLPGDPVPLLLYPPHWPVTVEVNRCAAGTQ